MNKIKTYICLLIVLSIACNDTLEVEYETTDKSLIFDYRKTYQSRELMHKASSPAQVSNNEKIGFIKARSYPLAMRTSLTSACEIRELIVSWMNESKVMVLLNLSHQIGWSLHTTSSPMQDYPYLLSDSITPTQMDFGMQTQTITKQMRRTRC